MRAQWPSKQPQWLASAVPHSRISVHMMPAVRGLLFTLATHSLAWHGSEGPQSASVEQASWLTLGAGSRQAGPLPVWAGGGVCAGAVCSAGGVWAGGAG